VSALLIGFRAGKFSAAIKNRNETWQSSTVYLFTTYNRM